MTTPAELREQARLHLQAAAAETVPRLKQRLAEQALALAQLAEKLERDAAAAQRTRSADQ